MRLAQQVRFLKECVVNKCLRLCPLFGLLFTANLKKLYTDSDVLIRDTKYKQTLDISVENNRRYSDKRRNMGNTMKFATLGSR